MFEWLKKEEKVVKVELSAEQLECEALKDYLKEKTLAKELNIPLVTEARDEHGNLIGLSFSKDAHTSIIRGSADFLQYISEVMDQRKNILKGQHFWGDFSRKHQPELIDIYNTLIWSLNRKFEKTDYVLTRASNEKNVTLHIDEVYDLIRLIVTFDEWSEDCIKALSECKNQDKLPRYFQSCTLMTFRKKTPVERIGEQRQ